MADQLEFDLVSPFLAEPASCARLREQARAHAGAQRELEKQIKLEGRLFHADLIHAPISIEELQQAKVLIGAHDWKRDHKKWERRAKKNPQAFRKALIAVKSKLNL